MLEDARRAFPYDQITRNMFRQALRQAEVPKGLLQGASENNNRGRLFVHSAAVESACLKPATSGPSARLATTRPIVAALIEELIEPGINYFHLDPFVPAHGTDGSNNVMIDAIGESGLGRSRRQRCDRLSASCQQSRGWAGHRAQRPRRNRSSQ